jgi:hypothetical protein
VINFRLGVAENQRTRGRAFMGQAREGGDRQGEGGGGGTLGHRGLFDYWIYQEYIQWAPID